MLQLELLARSYTSGVRVTNQVIQSTVLFAKGAKSVCMRISFGIGDYKFYQISQIALDSMQLCA
jgi:hypothetical protein